MNINESYSSWLFVHMAYFVSQGSAILRHELEFPSLDMLHLFIQLSTAAHLSDLVSFISREEFHCEVWGHRCFFETLFFNSLGNMPQTGLCPIRDQMMVPHLGLLGTAKKAVPRSCTIVLGFHHTCYSKRPPEATGVLFALLQLHAAHPDNLAHKADTWPDEVCAAEVL